MSEPNTQRSIFDGLSFDERKAFHSPSAQRARNKARREAREQGEVYDLNTHFKPRQNSTEINQSINDTQGNDEITLDSETENTVDITVCDDETGSTQILTVLTP